MPTAEPVAYYTDSGPPVFHEMFDAGRTYPVGGFLMAVSQRSLLWSLGFGLLLFGGSLKPATADGSSGYSYKVMHSKGRVLHHGVLTIDSSGVSYS